MVKKTEKNTKAEERATQIPTTETKTKVEAKKTISEVVKTQEKKEKNGLIKTATKKECEELFRIYPKESELWVDKHGGVFVTERPDTTYYKK